VLQPQNTKARNIRIGNKQRAKIRIVEYLQPANF
jgi:hypothetical protein